MTTSIASYGSVEQENESGTSRAGVSVGLHPYFGNSRRKVDVFPV
jgi:hypothetical protein